ncbi:MAG: hypothetical protein UV78_C0047G0009 [Parcubacteria group bacterium GW2011_GWA2_43_17]|nr:MAG: hypothetical protein UV78_C0047G0009 [Parcubacteria group bacterium GW2011_GWA2_43_17]
MSELKFLESGLLCIGIPLAMALNGFLDTIEAKLRERMKKIGRETCKKKLILSGVSNGGTL